MGRKNTCLCGLAVAFLAFQASQPAFSQSSSPDSDAAAREAQAKADEASYKAMAAAAQAKEAMHKADVAAAQAKFGGTTASSIQGDVTLSTASTLALKGEGLLLSVNAAKIASSKIVSALQVPLGKLDSDRPLMVLTSLADLATPDAIQFDFDASKSQALLQVAESAFAEAAQLDRTRAPDPTSQDDGSGRAAPFAMLGSMVGSLANIGSYFQSNYTLGEIGLELPATLIADSMISELKRDANTKTLKIVNPVLLIVTEANAMQSELAILQQRYMTVASNALAAKARYTILAAGDPKTCGSCAEVAMAYQLSEANSNIAKTAFESLIANLAAAPAAGQQPFAVRVARQRAVRDLMNGAASAGQKGKPYILLLANTAKAGYITKKNLWTFLGEPPVRAMGSMAVNYSLFDPSKSGEVIMSDAIAVHGGYKTLRGVERLFADESKPAP